MRVIPPSSTSAGPSGPNIQEPLFPQATARIPYPKHPPPSPFRTVAPRAPRRYCRTAQRHHARRPRFLRGRRCATRQPCAPECRQLAPQLATARDRLLRSCPRCAPQTANRQAAADDHPAGPNTDLLQSLRTTTRHSGGNCSGQCRRLSAGHVASVHSHPGRRIWRRWNHHSNGWSRGSRDTQAKAEFAWRQSKFARKPSVSRSARSQQESEAIWRTVANNSRRKEGTAKTPEHRCGRTASRPQRRRGRGNRGRRLPRTTRQQERPRIPVSASNICPRVVPACSATSMARNQHTNAHR
jgi:hypothetical protein